MLAKDNFIPLFESYPCVKLSMKAMLSSTLEPAFRYLLKTPDSFPFPSMILLGEFDPK